MLQVRRVLYFTLPILASNIVDIAGAVDAGTFALPYNPDQKWDACNEIGYATDSEHHQYHMEWYDEVGKYHMGEDWNGICGGDSDRGAELYALANGTVVYIDNEGLTEKGKRVIVRYTLPDNTQIDSEYLHCDTVMVSWSGSGTGDDVVKGQVIATLGGTGGWVPHLHWEMQKNLSLPVGTNPYQNPLTVSHALKYTAPSLFVDDRAFPQTERLISGVWTLIQPEGNAPSSTAYVSYADTIYSLQEAIDSGLIHQSLYYWTGTQWRMYEDADEVFFGKGVWHAFWAQTANAALTILVPGNNYLDDRARMDMVRSASRDGRFTNVRSEDFVVSVDWDPSWELRYMLFEYVGPTTSGNTYIYHATSTSNPLLRFTTFFDPDTNQWTPWQAEDVNVLY